MAHTDDNSAMMSLCTGGNDTVDSVDLNTYDTISLTRKAVVKQVKLTQRRVYALTGKGYCTILNKCLEWILASSL